MRSRSSLIKTALSLAPLCSLVAASTAFASAGDNVEVMVAQKIAYEYTGDPAKNVDGRLGQAVATLAGCRIGQYLKGEGMEGATELLAAQLAERTGMPIAVIRQGVELAGKKASFAEKLDKSLKDKCDSSQWEKKFDGLSALERLRGKKPTENLRVAEEILVEMKPVIDEQRQKVLQGDLAAVSDAMLKEGTRLGKVLRAIGKLDFESAVARSQEAALAGKSDEELQGLADALRARYKEACEPIRAYTWKKAGKKALNHASNVIEMTTSPVETMIEILIEKLMQGDSESLARLLRDENVAITRHDEEAHEHLQHERQGDECYTVERDLEQVLRQLRGRALGLGNRSVTPTEYRELGKDKQGLYLPR